MSLFSCPVRATIWHQLHLHRLTLSHKRTTDALRFLFYPVLVRKKTDPCFGRQLDHRFPEVKFAVAGSHFSVSQTSCCLFGSALTPRIISLIHRARRVHALLVNYSFEARSAAAVALRAFNQSKSDFVIVWNINDVAVKQVRDDLVLIFLYLFTHLLTHGQTKHNWT